MNELINSFKHLFHTTADNSGEAREIVRQMLDKIDWALDLDRPEKKIHPIVATQLEIACSQSGPCGSESNMIANALLETYRDLHWFSMYNDYEDEPDMAILKRNYSGTSIIGAQKL